jgi:hypothetical protein
MNRRRFFIILMGGISAIFLVSLYGMATDTYKIGVGLSYIAALEDAGLELGPQTTSEAYEIAAQNSHIIGYQYAIGKTLGAAFCFGALLSIIAYGFNFPSFKAKKTIIWGTAAIGLAALFLSLPTLLVGQSIDFVASAALGFWLFGFALVLIAVGIITVMRKGINGIGGVVFRMKVQKFDKS